MQSLSISVKMVSGLRKNIIEEISNPGCRP
jgi:hypothetical protein